MPVTTLHVQNFRGIKDFNEIEIRPITIFVGPNSSGKSTCLHALACLSQTIKTVSDDRPIILDDETAHVHLGRFIEVIHTKSYQDTLRLGITIPTVEVHSIVLKEVDGEQILSPTSFVDDVTATYSFKCSKRTQEISIESFEVKSRSPILIGRKSGNEYSVQTMSGLKQSVPKNRLFAQGFLVNEDALILSLKSTSKDALENLPSQFEGVPVKSAQSAIQSALGSTLYLGPFRQPPARRYASRGAAPTEVGAMGESTITMLANETVQSRTRVHLSQVSEWLGALGVATAVDVSRIASSDLFNVSLTLPDNRKFPIADLGYGLSQVLPVLTQCSFAPEGSTLLFEQPELHVHPLAVKGLSQIFIETAKEKNAHICIETHSPELVRSFFNKVKNGHLNTDDLRVYRVMREDGQTTLKAIDVDAYGDNDGTWAKDLLFS